MKNFIITISLLFLSIAVNGQNFRDLAEYQFTDQADYAEQKSNVLKCTNYMFENPFDKNDLNRLHCTQFIIKWMEGTPDYTFEIGDDAMKLTRGNSDIFGLYLVALTKTLLENPEIKLSQEEIHEKAQNLLIDYCSKSENNLKPTRMMRKLMKNADRS